MTRARGENFGLIAPARPHKELMVWEALNIALDRALEADEAVFLLGEDVGLYGGSYRVTQGLYAKYGEWRVRATRPSRKAASPASGWGRRWSAAVRWSRS